VSRLGIDAEVIAWQLADIEQYGIGAEQAMTAVQWVDIDGTVRRGHEAIAAALREGGFALRILGRLMVLPGISRLSALAYRLVARYRCRLPGRTPVGSRSMGRR
jgi:predicted DCC family thiol-disulfide oxidoreductase YuxK